MAKAARTALICVTCSLTSCITVSVKNFDSLLGQNPAEHWRGFRKADLPAGWQLVDGALTRVGAGGDIITREQYDDFELTLEWKISPGGNSGIFYRVVEDSSLNAVYLTGSELQVLDNKGHADGKIPNTSAGSNFALYAPTRDVTRPVGEWNQVRLVVEGPHVEHWLNGEKVVEYEMWSDDWATRMQASKFKNLPLYGDARRGHIALQDHGDWVAFRNIRIRRIK
jgi:hypothetical protein